jgi:hypothetical protein
LVHLPDWFLFRVVSCSIDATVIWALSITALVKATVSSTSEEETHNWPILDGANEHGS